MGGNGLIVTAGAADRIEGLDRVPSWHRGRSISKGLKKAGYRVYLVGGAVRDLLRNKLPEDVDLLTDAGPEDIKGLFPDRKVRYVGKRFGVTLVDGIEVAGCRFSRTPDGKGRFPEDDLSRRDLTINSMALDPFTGDLSDPFGGRADLACGKIRFTQNALARITEDPLRMIRACRFAGELGGHIPKEDFYAMVSLNRLVADEAAPERIQAELLKAMVMEHPSRFFSLLHDTGLLAQILPCLDRCYDLDGGPHHGETVFEHCMLCLLYTSDAADE